MNAETGSGFAPKTLTKLPLEMSDALLHRGDWSLCAMDHSRIEAIEFEAPGVPFHHLALPMKRTPLRLALKVDGRRQIGRTGTEMVTMIRAGDGGATSWDGVYESACFYFTTHSLGAALGRNVEEHSHSVRTAVDLHSPSLVRLLRALQSDAQAGQPHGTLVGDSIFVALAAQLVPKGDHHRAPPRVAGEAARVGRAIEYIQANLTDRLNVGRIASAASTSPFYLNHAFRAALGCSIWQYVLRERARYAFMLLRNPNLTLLQVSEIAGFETYASFITSAKREYGSSPRDLRRAHSKS